MEQSPSAADESIALTWRARLRRQRLVAVITLIFVIGVLWLADWTSGEGLFSSAHWPLLMPLPLLFLSAAIAGRHQHGGRDYRAAGLVAGDHGAVRVYPEVVQRALIRAVAAGAETSTLLPVPHRVLWRLRLAVPPVAFASFWANFLPMFGMMFVALPLWFFVQDWRTPGGSDMLRQTGILATLALAALAALAAKQRAGERERLGLPTWREFRDRSSRGEPV